MSCDHNDWLIHAKGYHCGFCILDLTLPGSDGFGLTQLLRRRGTAGMRVVPGRVAPDAFERVLRGGGDMHLSKPVSFDAVVPAVEAERRRARVSVMGPRAADRGLSAGSSASVGPGAAAPAAGA